MVDELMRRNSRGAAGRYRAAMADRDRGFGGVRLWVAPALGVGLLVAGIGLALGLSSGFAPIITVGVAGVILSIGKWREMTLARQRDVPPARQRDVPPAR